MLAACRPTPLPPGPKESRNPAATASDLERPRPTPASSSGVNRPDTDRIGPSSGPAEVAARGGTAIFGLVGQPYSLNPITDTDPALAALTPLLFDTLLQVDPQTARLQPGLARSWEYSQDGQQVIFHLPSDLKWSDGSPLTAADLVDSLEAGRHPALLAFSHIQARNSETLALSFAETDCAAVTALARLPLLPATEITATVPTGSGPFVVEDWSPGRSLTLARNPNYRQPEPWLDGLHLRFLGRDEIEIALSEGQFDLVGPVPAPGEPAGEPAFTDLTYPAAQVIYLAINFDPRNGEPISPETRQALLLALDREAILTEALAGDGQLVAGSLLPTHWAANHDLSLPAYDPETARTLLARTGLRDSDGDGWLDRDGQRLELGIRLSGQNGLYQDLGWLLSSYYRDLGLFVRAESVPVDSVIDDLFTHDFSLAIFGWPILPDPDQRLYWHSVENAEGVGLNFTSYSNARLDSLLEEGVAVAGCDLEVRAEIYGDIQQILAEERPVDFLLAPNRHLLVGSRLQGVQPGPFAPLTWNVTEWYLREN